jgi:hypothetical protein
MARYIITASEATCSALCHRLKNHKLVQDTFENSGYWYTNGETGPEWFTATIEADYKYKEEIEQLVDETLKEIESSASNYFWG